MNSNRFGFPRLTRALLLAGLAGGSTLVATEAHAQVTGNTNKPLPNVLLLVDTSGSMERTLDGKMPSANAATTCVPGTASTPNRWGTLLQSLTGNFQPYYSCEAMARDVAPANANFTTQYSISGVNPYDTGYNLPYHRPVTGGTAATACVNVPYQLAGGLTPGLGSTVTGPAETFPPNAIASFLQQPLSSSNSLQSCTFDQAADGQLDAVLDFVRFGLMTFDTDQSKAIGVSSGPLPTAGNYLADPFTGQWSYTRSSGNPLFSTTTPNGVGRGNPPGCGGIEFEVGARHWAAPPWEGRQIRFPNPIGSLYDIEATNAQIQQVLLGSRPYGATPLDGMLDDARDYLWYNDYGPWGSQVGYKDPYVQSPSHCRDQFIILLTDGAPTLNMRPACEAAGGTCPYQNAYDIADALYKNLVSKSQVKTFVIGFSVNGSGDYPTQNDGFPAGITDCKAWYNAASPAGGGGNPATMDATCATRAAAGQLPRGSTAEACCQLNKIAWFGSGGNTASPPTPPVGAYFANNGADLVIAFSQILASITKSATSRSTPGTAPASTAGAGGLQTATYVASFIPNARKVWSGEIDRTRVCCGGYGAGCTGAAPAGDTPAQAVTKGDSYAVDTAIQTGAHKRLFITALGATTTGSMRDSLRTMRPFQGAATTNADGIPAYVGDENYGLDDALYTTTGFTEAMGVDNTTCKRSAFIVPAVPPSTANTTQVIPALNAADCTHALWTFETASTNAATLGTPSFTFNKLRCETVSGNSSATSGKCSISGQTCSIDNPSATCTSPGEACVPECAALGAIYRSVPTVVGPPSGFLRDEGFRQFQSLRSNRRSVMYVATTDGILHAFKAFSDTLSDMSPGGNNYELWAFVPPAVLPRIATNFPGGQQTLLDGTPVVKDVVWYRTGGGSSSVTDSSLNKNDWHTTLVASLGSGGAGYYGLNVSDADCGGWPNVPNNTEACRGGSTYYDKVPSGAANLIKASVGADTTNGATPGPHFLWQLTDVEKATGDWAKVSRTTPAPDSKTFVSLFGRRTFTPAITTINVLVSSVPTQIGVAILPGGIDGPPSAGTGCQRAVKGGYGSFASADVSDTSNTPTRTNARQWGTSCSAPVPGRGITMVRLDTGEVIRVFGRKTQDVPKNLSNVTTDSPFDSPVIGTPVVYPATLGAAAQKIFVGDADGAIWRIDVSEPCAYPITSSCSWKTELFADIPSIAGSTAAVSQPIAISPIVSETTKGSLVVNVATGDQENIVVSTEKNYVLAIEEQRVNVSAARKANVLWYSELTNGHRVTGPMAVFDRTLYFASFQPQAAVGSDVCGAGAKAFLWGVDYQTPASSISSGGAPRWCPSGNVSSSGQCSVAVTQNEDATTLQGGSAELIPGVAVTSTLACTQTGNLNNDYFSGLTAISPTEYHIDFTWSKPRTGSAIPATSSRASLKAATPRYNASLDAWAFVTQ